MFFPDKAETADDLPPSQSESSSPLSLPASSDSSSASSASDRSERAFAEDEFAGAFPIQHVHPWQATPPLAAQETNESASGKKNQQNGSDNNDETLEGVEVLVVPESEQEDVGGLEVPITDNSRGMILNDGDDIDDPETLRNQQLANAWIAKRGREKIRAARSGMQLSYDITSSSEGPIDVDQAMEQGRARRPPRRRRRYVGPVDLDEDPPQEDGETAACSSDDESDLGPLPSSFSQSSLSSIPMAPTLLPIKMLEQQQHMPDDRVSVISAATSDMTPVICNKAAPRRGRRVNKTDPLAEIEEQPRKEGSSWRDFCDYRTYQGKLVLLLLAIFVLALVTIVTSIVVQRQNQQSLSTSPSTGDTGRPSNPVMTFPPQPGPITNGRPTNSPSLRPTFAPTSASPTVAPTGSPTHGPTAFPTSAPTVAFSDMTFESIGIGNDSGGPLVLRGGNELDLFGSSIALSADGTVLVIGARDAITTGGDEDDRSGQVRVFARDSRAGSPWVERGPPLDGRQVENSLGSAVAVNADGSILALSEPGHDGAGDRAGSVRVFRYIPSTNAYEVLGQELSGSPVSLFGASLSLSHDGRRLAIGAPSANGRYRIAGQVRVYELSADDSEWRLMGSPLEGTSHFDWLGFAVDLSEDGRVLIASAPVNSSKRGYVRVWNWRANKQEWISPLSEDLYNFEPRAVSGDRFGQSISVSKAEYGNDVYLVAVGAPFKNVDRDQPNGGMTTVFEVKGSSWEVLGQSIGGEEDQEVGKSVQLLDGKFLLVGAPGDDERKGIVKLFRYERTVNRWEENLHELDGLSPKDDYGHSVAMARLPSGHFVLAVGAVTGGDNGAGYVSSYEQSN